MRSRKQTSFWRSGVHTHTHTHTHTPQRSSYSNVSFTLQEISDTEILELTHSALGRMTVIRQIFPLWRDSSTRCMRHNHRISSLLCDPQEGYLQNLEVTHSSLTSASREHWLTRSRSQSLADWWGISHNLKSVTSWKYVILYLRKTWRKRDTIHFDVWRQQTTQ